MIQTLNRILKQLQAAESHIFQFIGFRLGCWDLIWLVADLPLWKMVSWEFLPQKMKGFPQEKWRLLVGGCC